MSQPLAFWVEAPRFSVVNKTLSTSRALALAQPRFTGLIPNENAQSGVRERLRTIRACSQHLFHLRQDSF